MATLDEIREARMKKLETVQKDGLNPFPETSKRTHSLAEAKEQFDQLAADQKEIVVTGRIRSLRPHGGLAFVDIDDGTAKFQAIFIKTKIGPKGFEFFADNFDIGDFIEIRGILFTTKQGEKTIEAADFKMLAKSLRPLPEKWHGLTDVEERYRKRYLDLIFNADIKKKFELRFKIIREIRNFMDNEGFLEVETPILQTLYGGAKAKPFTTHINALDMDVYLRISPELYLKRLLIGGFEKIFEIGKCFRNEGIDKSHNPDFTMMEFYWAYADYRQVMKLAEKMIGSLVEKFFNGEKIIYQGQEIDFKGPWQRMEYTDLLSKYADINYDEISEKGLAEKARKLGVDIPEGSNKPAIADEIYKKLCRPKLVNPTFLLHYPKGFQPLAKQMDDNPQRLANFQLVIAGVEVVNAFSELNDPVEQRARFQEQESLFKGGFEEAQRSDQEFLEAMEYGMPTAGGFGMGIDRLISLLTDSNSLREVILFPTMKSREAGSSESSAEGRKEKSVKRKAQSEK
ncbi:MAG: lysine--tRNA ligase [Candidatus Paceibacterota bacterium]|jgi:lysyl-tRNA synthetase class 2